MDSLRDWLFAVPVWRLLVNSGASIVPGAFSSPFSCIGTALGDLRLPDSETGIKLTDPAPSDPIAKPIAFLGLAVMGRILGGGIAAGLPDSAALGTQTLVATAGPAGLWDRLAGHRVVPSGQLVYSAISLLRLPRSHHAGRYPPSPAM